MVMRWPDEMYKFVKHRVPFTHQVICERAIHGAIRLPEYTGVLSAMSTILDDDASRQFQTSLKILTLNQTLIFHLPASPITSSGSYLTIRHLHKCSKQCIVHIRRAEHITCSMSRWLPNHPNGPGTCIPSRQHTHFLP